jgi:single-stranded-DNA-specific exonuclease
VIGIVASRLVERHNRPVIVVSLGEEGGGRGSGRSIPGFDLLAGLEACSEHLVRFGGHRAAAGLELRAENLEAFRSAFAAHATAVLGTEDLRRTERIDAMVGGANLGLDLAEELGRLAPFGMGNPGVRLLVPAARVRDVRTMGEGKHSRFSLHSGAHRALGVAFGRSTLGVGDDDPVDAAVRLEVNHWNGAVEPRVVLRELYPREVVASGDVAGIAEPRAERDAGGEEWWQRFDAELTADLEDWPPAPDVVPDGKVERRVVRGSNSPAAVVGELLSSGESVIALAADAPRRVGLASDGLVLADYARLELEPDLTRRFTHVVLVDPPAFRHLEGLASRPSEEGGFLHLAWGEVEYRFALSALESHLAGRRELAEAFRELREAGDSEGERLRATLMGAGAHPRSPETAARCLRVLSELSLVQGEPNGGAGVVGVVSSERTDLERSAAFRAYRARYEEGQRYLERRRQP